MVRDLFCKAANDYYDGIREINENAEYVDLRNRIYQEADRYRDENPTLSHFAHRAHLYELVAESFKPIIHPWCPFYFEMGIKSARSIGGGPITSIGMWGADASVRRARNLEHIKRFGYAEDGDDPSRFLGVAYGPVFDEDHHSPGYTVIFEKGLSGIIADLDRFLATDSPESEEHAFRSAARCGLLAMIRVAERFAEEAERLLPDARDERERRCLEMIANTARRVPREAPKSFYEGLCTLIFIYEVVDSLDALGMSVLGHVDRLLEPLYAADIASGALTVKEAEELVEIWLSIQDVKCDSLHHPWADISCTIELGGCDAEGREVFGEVTKMMVKLHEKHNLINPKLNCRISSHSSEEYLDLISGSLLRGHNVIALINDDTVIPALISTGKELSDARLYVNGGCQETVVEGCEHSAGVMFYFNLPRVLDLALVGTDETVYPDEIRWALPGQIGDAEDFEQFYARYLEGMKRMLYYATETRRVHGEKWGDSHPSPIFSATLKGCIENGRDFTKGGAKYNVGTACGVGFATLSDSLYAIKRAVFEDKTVTLSELRCAMRENFVGFEEVRSRLIEYPKFAHGDPEADEFAGRVFGDINDYVETLDNERGGKYVFSTFTFGNHVWAARYVGAMPDGKLAGETLSQSTGPSRTRKVESLTDAIRAQSALHLERSGGISVLDVMLPVGSDLDEQRLSATLRAFCLLGGQALQPNRVTRERMLSAKKEPDKHRDLIVRVCGLSVYFVNLSEVFQDDMIARNAYSS